MLTPDTAPPSLDRATAILRDSRVFRGLPEEALEALAAVAHVRSVAVGAVLMREGEPADCLHVIAGGRLSVTRRAAGPPGAELRLAVLGPGDVVGEMGLLDGAPRSATVTALEPTTTLELPAETIAVAVLQYPVASGALLQTVSRRLRNANDLARRIAEAHGAAPGAY